MRWQRRYQLDAGKSTSPEEAPMKVMVATVGVSSWLERDERKLLL